MPKIYSSLACNLDTDIVAAALPLLEESKVEALEWSFDTLFSVKTIPEWYLNLLRAFSNENRLIGHGVFFSLLSGKWSEQQQNWLNHLKQVAGEFNFDHVTEHFGFMTGENFHHGAPLSIPYTQATLSIGRDRLMRIQDACRCPVGIENLAFSYSLEEVKQHGGFLGQLIEPINGFIILDLHNLYCQIHNFNLEYDDIIKFYPLNKVREIHISGGSWEDSKLGPLKKVRRDTHDSAVPLEVFELLEATIDICPNLKFVVFEQLGTGLKSQQSKAIFYDDFLKMDKIIKSKNQSLKNPDNSFLSPPVHVQNIAIEDEKLYQQQLELSYILENATSYEDAKKLLGASSLAFSEWNIEKWEPYMLETALNIARKWK
ncbi:MAG: DUF692 domain-containing protein [Bacteroidota bacterium]|nr:DUF692 domain-containing protein [Bacteroidota bacterium]